MHLWFLFSLVTITMLQAVNDEQEQQNITMFLNNSWKNTGNTPGSYIKAVHETTALTGYISEEKVTFYLAFQEEDGTWQLKKKLTSFLYWPTSKYSVEINTTSDNRLLQGTITEEKKFLFQRCYNINPVTRAFTLLDED